MNREELYAQIQNLLDRGDHRAAAIGFEELGDLGRARALLEGLFDYPEAGRLAELEGDMIGALELYLKGGRVQDSEKVRRALMADLADELPAALQIFESRGFYVQAAELAESIGRLSQAAALYQKASSHKRSAVLLERLGRLREAGEAFEASLVGAPDDADANLGLGRVLQRFGRHREALSLLVRSVRDPHCAMESARRIAAAFFKLGMLEAGRAALERAGLPRTTDPDEFVRPFEDELQQGGAGGGDGRSHSGAVEGRYRLEKPLGGRVGASYMGRDLLSQKPVVVRFFAGSPLDNAEFFDELERLKHAHFSGHVRVLEIHREGGFVVSEFVEGHSLLSALRDDAPPTAMQCRGLAVQILDAVSVAHRAGVLHGALTPACVRLAPGGACLVDDWGVRHIEKRLATQTGGPESAFAYRSPELNIGRSADFRADLYSVAAVLYRGLIGRSPLMGRGREGFDDWPPEFADFFEKALAAGPDDRFGSHDAFRRGLVSLPWVVVASRRVEPTAASGSMTPLSRGPRFVTDHAPDIGEIVTASDALLGRDVRLLRLPPEAERPVQLVDRLTALAGPEVPVFQDILRFDEEGQAIVLEVMAGAPVSSIVAKQGAIDPVIALDAGQPLLAGIAAAHVEGVGLGGIGPDSIRFDGQGLRAPIEQSLLAPPGQTAETIESDAIGFWAALMLVIDGKVHPEPGPAALVRSLRARGHLLARDEAPLLEQLPASSGSLVPYPDWFEGVRRAVDTCIVRRAVFERLKHVLASDGELSDEELQYLAERRRIFGLE